MFKSTIFQNESGFWTSGSGSLFQTRSRFFNHWFDWYKCLLRWLPAIKCPVLILHAEDDGVVPFRLGETLFEEAVQAGKTNIRWVTHRTQGNSTRSWVWSASRRKDLKVFLTNFKGYYSNRLRKIPDAYSCTCKCEFSFEEEGTVSTK